MRSLRLAQIAAQAEGLRWRHRLRRLIVRIVCLVLAIPFLLAAFGFLEAAFWIYMREHFIGIYAALIIVGGNLAVVLMLLLFMWSRSGEDRVSLEALEVRRRALDSAQQSVSMVTLMAPVARFLFTQVRARRRRD